MTSIQLHSKKSEILHRAQVALDAHGHNSEAYKALVKDAEDVQGDIDMLAAIERSGVNNRNAPAPAPTMQNPAPVMIVNRDETPEQRRQRINTAYSHYLRNGRAANAAEQRDLAVNSDATGAALVPQGFDDVWTDALRNVSPITTLVKSKLTADGRPTKHVITDATAINLSYVAETGSTSPAVQNPVVSSHIPGTDALVGRVTVSWQEMVDGFDIETFLRGVASVVVGRGLEYAILTGTDPGTQTALPNSLTAGGLRAFAPVAFTTPTIAAGIGYQNLLAVRAAVDHAYAFGPNSGFLASQSVHDYLAQQVDATGRQFYKRDPVTNLLLIDGSPLYVAGGLTNSPMPAYNAPASNVVLFGDYSRAYSYNHTDVRFKVINLNPQLMTSDIFFYIRIGATGLLSSAVAALKTAAS